MKEGTLQLDTTQMERNMRNYYEQLYTNKWAN